MTILLMSCGLSSIRLCCFFREAVLYLAHEIFIAGHLSNRKTQENIGRHFYWPKMYKDVVSYCHSYACQVVPLCPLPVTDEPFSQVLIDWPFADNKEGE